MSINFYKEEQLAKSILQSLIHFPLNQMYALQIVYVNLEKSDIFIHYIVYIFEMCADLFELFLLQEVTQVVWLTSQIDQSHAMRNRT